MAQFLKDDVQTRIAEAALRVFAERGYREATVAQIAKAAGVSTGNVYRYYENKDTLFYEVVPEGFVRELRTRLRARVEAARGTTDLTTLGPGSAYVRASAALLEFSLTHRHAVIIALGRAAGSRYADVGDEVSAELVALAIDYAASVSRPVTESMRFALERIYTGFVGTIVAILETYATEAEIRAALEDFGRYHLFGLRHFFR